MNNIENKPNTYNQKEETYLKDIYLKYKNIDFLEIIVRDCLAWIDFYDREIEYIEDQIKWKTNNKEYYEFEVEQGRKLTDFDMMRYQEHVSDLKKDKEDLYYSEDQKHYWIENSKKWKKELDEEKQKQKVI